MNDLLIHKKCASRHFGLWIAEPDWFIKTFQAIRAGYMQANLDLAVHGDGNEGFFRVDVDGIAHVGVMGMMMKAESKFGGVSTVEVRKAIRAAAGDNAVSTILLHIDSPGGTVSGTAALVDDIKAVNEIKPVHVHIEDLGASAAFWIASQARRITAERTSLIGSIGTFAYVVDTSKEYEAKGWVAHVISTGKFKGMGGDGMEITKAEIAYIQQMVDDVNVHFVADVASGRNMTLGQVEAVADGRVHDAQKAFEMGLIDAVQGIDETVEEISENIRAEKRRAGQARYEIARASLRQRQR